MDSSFGAQLASTFVALAFVLSLAGVSLWLLKRWQGRDRGGVSASAAPTDLRFVRALPVGAKERVVLIAYAGEHWLLGVTTGGITLLGRQPAQQEPAAPGAPGAQTNP